MRSINRVLIGALACAPALLIFPATAVAAEPTHVTYAFEVDGSTVSNTITNNSETELTCTTSLAPAPVGVLPPVWEVIGNGQTLYATGSAGPTGETTQSIVDVPAGTYVALATCATSGDSPTVWISDYPGLDAALATVPWTSHTVQQASPIVTIGAPAPALPDLGSLLSSGSAG